MATDVHFPIGTRFGNYELTAFLGEGGMGTVYAAVHLGLGKKVAIKTLRSDLASDTDLRMRFLREGKAAAAVRHPNVVDVDDVGVAGETPYLVMELLEGEDLGASVMRLGRLSVSDTADTMIPVLLAMSEAHRAGVVHRDLKPDNIFLARDYHGTTVPKVLDFGISKLREAQSLGLTGNNTMLGTPYYMSPEQAGSARDVDARSDLYSIGVILYHCVSGRVPFSGTSLAHVIGQILHAQPIPLRELSADVPSAFEAIVSRAMAKDPGQRPQDALTLARALLPFASHRTQVSYGTVLHAEGSEDTVHGPQPSAAGPRGAVLRTHTPLAHSVATPTPSSPLSRRVLATLLLMAAGSAGLFVYLREAPARPTAGAANIVLPRDVSVPAERLEDAPPDLKPASRDVEPPVQVPVERQAQQLPLVDAGAQPARLDPENPRRDSTKRLANPKPQPSAAGGARHASGARPTPEQPTPPPRRSDDDIWNDRH